MHIVKILNGGQQAVQPPSYFQMAKIWSKLIPLSITLVCHVCWLAGHRLLTAPKEKLKTFVQQL